MAGVFKEVFQLGVIFSILSLVFDIIEAKGKLKYS